MRMGLKIKRSEKKLGVVILSANSNLHRFIKMFPTFLLGSLSTGKSQEKGSISQKKSGKLKSRIMQRPWVWFLGLLVW